MNKYLALTILIVSFLTFFFLGKHPVSPWNEARNGVNAIEMLNNKDWINLHYAGQPDSWNTKPPLVTWSIAASFYFFGKNEWALRLPSALAIIGAFVFIFKIINLYRSEKFAFLACLLLASVDGLIGWHIGRTGDYDAHLVFMLMGSVYFFIRLYNSCFKKLSDSIFCGIFFGLAFLVKGPAAFVLFPGLFLFLLFERELIRALRKKYFWLTGFLISIFVLGWGAVQYVFGIQYSDSSNGGNAYERLFVQDLVKRFAEEGEGWKSAMSLDFFFYSLDKSFNVWNYLFFGFLLFGVFHFFKNNEKVFRYFEIKRNKLLLLSLCLYFPLAIFLTLAAKSNTWYLAPVLPFVGIATFWGVDFFWRRYKWTKFVFLGLLVFTLGRQVWHFSKPKEMPPFIVENEKEIRSANAVYQAGKIEQDVMLYLYFLNENIKFEEPENLFKKGVLVKSENGAPVLKDFVTYWSR